MFTKDDILNEIRRTAKENGGIPLGNQRFNDKTGIAEWDWRKYWARFGDAQREAGFSANKLNAAFEESFLFEKFIALTRELNKLPVRGDLIVKRNNDNDFPTHNTFARIGAKQKFLEKLLKYSESKSYKDIVNLCRAALQKESPIESEDEGFRKDQLGSVYLAKSGRYYKIGRTNSMGRRHHEISILLPENFELIHEIKTDDPSGIEAYWHKRFESKHKQGEWFDLNASDVRAFRSWRKIV